MGKSTKNKQKKQEEADAQFRAGMARLIRQARATPEPDPLMGEFSGYAGCFVRDPADFAIKGKSRDRDRHIIQMARHLFGRSSDLAAIREIQVTGTLSEAADSCLEGISQAYGRFPWRMTVASRFDG